MFLAGGRRDLPQVCPDGGRSRPGSAQQIDLQGFRPDQDFVGTLELATGIPIGRAVTGPVDHERTFRELVDDFPDLVCRITPAGTLLYVNRTYAAYFGRSRTSLVGTSFLDLVPEAEKLAVAANLADVGGLTPEHPVRTDEHRGGDDLDGSARWQQWVDKALFDGDGQLLELLCVGRDVTDRVVAEQRLTYHSRHDALTGLVNRRCTLEAIDAAVEEATRTSTPLGLLFVDLDGFKQINDRDGHRAGDRVLSEVAGVLARSVRNQDAAGRLGGDEFVVVCKSIETMVDLEDVAVRITKRLAAMVRPIEASIGAVVLRPGETADDLLHRADSAMYADKQRRRLTNRAVG